MAIMNSRFPHGKWDKNTKTDHWLVYKKFSIFDDASGGEYVQLQQDLRNAITEARDILDEHKVPIQNVYTEEMMDYKNFGKMFGVALGFACREDMIMAKLVLKCEESY
jgi:hypothetical protein